MEHEQRRPASWVRVPEAVAQHARIRRNVEVAGEERGQVRKRSGTGPGEKGHPVAAIKVVGWDEGVAG